MANRSDNFDRADSSTALGSPSDGGGAYSITGNGGAAGTGGISSNRAYSPTANTYASLDAGVAVASVEATVAVHGSNYGLLTRSNSTHQDFLLLSVGAASISLFKRVAGTITQLGSGTSITVGIGSVLKLDVDAANAIRGYVDGVLRIGPTTDAAGATLTRYGFRILETVTRLDNLAVTDPAAGGGAQSITGAGIDSAEATGAAIVSSLATVVGAGLATGEAIGSAAVSPGAVTLTATGIASAEAVGAAMVGTGGLLIGGAGIASAEAVGAAILTPGTVALAPAGIASAGALGDPTLSAVATVQAQGIASAEAIGAAILAPGVATIAAAGVASEETIGSAVLTLAGASQVIIAVAVATAEAVGGATVTIVEAASVSLRQGLYAHLRTDRALAPLVGRRIYPDLAPAKAGVPSLVYSVLADARQGNLDGRTGVREARVQVECRSDTRGQCVQLAELVDDRLDGVSYSLGGVAVRWCHQEDEQDVTEPIPDGDASNRYLYPVTFTINYRA